MTEAGGFDIQTLWQYLPFGLFVFIALLVLFAIVSMSRQTRAAANELWKEAARTLGLSYKASGGLFGASARVFGTVDGAEVRVSRFHTFESGSKTAQVWTRVEAWTGALPTGFYLRIGTAAAGDRFFAAGQRVTLDSDRLGDSIVVRSNQPDLARQILRSPLINDLAGLGDADIGISEGAVVLSCRDEVLGSGALVAMVRAAVKLAAAPEKVLGKGNELAAAVGGTVGTADGWQQEAALPPIAIEAPGIRLRVEAADGGARVRIAAERGEGDEEGEGPASIDAEADADEVHRAIEAFATAARTDTPYRR